jgi:hypothetical protein
LNLIRVGSGTPGPKAKTSPVPSVGINVNKFAAASETAERIKA